MSHITFTGTAMSVITRHTCVPTDPTRSQQLIIPTWSISDGERMLGEAACVRVLAGLVEVLCAACDYAHDRCAKLLHARSREHGLDKMTASEFLTLSRIIEDFVADTEKVCGRKSTSFRMGLQGQATRFVGRFHEERDARYKLNMNNERWRAVYAPPDLQRLLDHISTTDTLVTPPAAQPNGDYPKSNTISTTTITNNNNSPTITTTNGVTEHSETNDSSNSGGGGGGGGGGGVCGGVMVGGEEYMVVGVCVVVVRLVVEYSECAATLRLAALQLLTRLTDLLRRFNTDTCRSARLARLRSVFRCPPSFHLWAGPGVYLEVLWEAN
ncbi:vacuolar protein sorting-associated protein 54-like [Portunus trituberculatus]|uniref:vacuolar protein sorting-associated protein 54-like n=1 Tax=Portunus trituberculatus TaxID=210409 RepID=UPI001E1CDBFC|nr:vacuolar protein sorting-associated protein 54-like [Portunus trituberculatus]